MPEHGQPAPDQPEQPDGRYIPNAVDSLSSNTPYYASEAGVLRDSLFAQEEGLRPRSEITLLQREGFSYVVATPKWNRQDAATGEPAPPILFVPGASEIVNYRTPISAGWLADACGQPVVTAIRSNQTEWLAAFNNEGVKLVETDGNDRYIKLDTEHAKPFTAALEDVELNQLLGIADGETPKYDAFAYSRGTNILLLAIQENPLAFENIYLRQPQGFGKIRTARRLIKGVRMAKQVAVNALINGSAKSVFDVRDLDIDGFNPPDGKLSTIPNRFEQLSVARARNLNEIVDTLRQKNPDLRWCFSVDEKDHAPSEKNLLKAMGESRDVMVTKLGAHGIHRARNIYTTVRSWLQDTEHSRAA